jgi:uncharacterized protein (TIGR03435 family)
LQLFIGYLLIYKSISEKKGKFMYNNFYLGRICFFVVLIVLAFSSKAYSQADEKRDNTGNDVAFDVVSIKECPQGNIKYTLLSFDENRFMTKCKSVEEIIQYGFFVRSYQLKWKANKIEMLFDIDARLTEEQTKMIEKLPIKQQWDIQRKIVSKMLRDRFGVVAHEESEYLPSYIITVSDKGIRFKVTSETTDTESLQPAMDFSHVGKLHAQNVHMSDLVKLLSSDLNSDVVDCTGISGRLTFDLSWKQNIDALFSQFVPDFASSRHITDKNDEYAPLLPTALREQLGLILKYKKMPQKVLIVDSIHAPIAN